NLVSLPLKLVQPSIYATALAEDKYLADTRMYLAVSAEASQAEVVGKTPNLVKVCSASHIEHLVSPVLRATSAALGCAVLVGLVWFLSSHWTSVVKIGPYLASVGGLAITALLAIAGILFPLFKWLRPREAMQSAVAKTVLAFTGFIFANIHLWTFDKLFLRRGRLKRLMRLN
ncbi:MAG TPA: type VI secretion system baseplate subunit TssK, partial [Candidatus Angelobacter sp.]